MFSPHLQNFWIQTFEEKRRWENLPLREAPVKVYSLNWWYDDMRVDDMVVDCYISCLLSPGSIDDMIIWWQWDNVTLHCNVTLHYSLPCYIYFLSPLSWISCANWQFARCPQQRTVPTSSHVLPWPLSISFSLFIIIIIVFITKVFIVIIIITYCPVHYYHPGWVAASCPWW